jgi:hydrogenase maturation factor
LPPQVSDSRGRGLRAERGGTAVFPQEVKTSIGSAQSFAPFRIEHPCRIAPDRVQPGDVLLLNGDVGRHGIAVIAVREDVQGACEMRGLDPLYVANEGRFVAFVAPHDAGRALGLMRSYPLGRGACLVGRVTDAAPAPVSMQSRIGARRIVDMLSGEQLPRIC